MLKDRIKQVRKTVGLTQVEYGKLLGVAGNTITNYENGMREPSNLVITAICREFNVNEEWEILEKRLFQLYQGKQ